MNKNTMLPGTGDSEAWRRSLLKLEDSTFFMIMRLYLGELKTPYNKQKLIEQLEGFLRREETQKNITALLSKEDRQILCAVNLLPETPEEELSQFFYDEISDFHERINNLKSRLLIYTDTTSWRRQFRINPVLKDSLRESIKESLLFPPYKSDEPLRKNRNSQGRDIFCLLGVFLAFVAQNPKLCKLDGSIKKRAQEKLSEIFPQETDFFQYLNSLTNLGLTGQSDEEFFIDWKMLDSFSKLEKCEQLLYLFAASGGHLSKGRLQNCAQNFLDAVNSIPQSGFEKNIFIKYLSFLSKKNTQEKNSLSSGRFSQILHNHMNARDSFGDPPGSSNTDRSHLYDREDELERLTDYAVKLGLLDCAVQKNKTSVVFRGGIFDTADTPGCRSEGIFLNIDSSGIITVMPGLSFEKILQVVKFADAVKLDTIARFEITKASVIRAFDAGMSSQDIISFIKEVSGFEMPEALQFSVRDWEENYKTVKIYNGFIISLDEKKSVLLEKNAEFKKHIAAVIAPNVFLLDCTEKNEVNEIIANCGMDFAGKIRTVQPKTKSKVFSSLDFDHYQGERNQSQTNSSRYKEEAEDEKTLASLYSRIEETGLSAEQKGVLRDIASSKMLVNSSQLRAPAIPVSKNSAQGMDYSGKLYIIEQALKSGEGILFRLSKNSPLQKAVPLSVNKKGFNDGAYVYLKTSGGEQAFSIGKIEFIQRLNKISIYQEK